MQETDNNFQPQQTEEPRINSESNTQKHSGASKNILLFIIVIILVAVSAFGGYSIADGRAQKESEKLRAQIADLQANTHDLPTGAIKVSECIPNMGAHYVTSNSDPKYGPFLLVNKANRVIGVEYMVSTDMYTPIPGLDPPIEILRKDSSVYGWKFDHLEFSRAPEGHEGFLEDHIDLHLYTVTPEQQKDACK